MVHGTGATLPTARLSHKLHKYEEAVNAELAKLASKDFCKRLWAKDAGLWTGADECKWLGWLDIVSQQLSELSKLDASAKKLLEGNFKHLVLLGMGGSSLCVEVMRQTFGKQNGFPEMLVLDSVVPAQVLAIRKAIDPASTLFIVASKSGSTTEPNVLCQFFYDECKKVVGEKAGDHFVAITDPGSSMEARAKEFKFAHTSYGVPSIGGRFSALSNFGMLPAALMGLDLKSLLSNAAEMVAACSAEHEPKDNPGVLLGVILGVLSREKRDKVTLVASPAVASLGTWLEQLIAESTGKDNKGIVPIAAETLSSPDTYGKDRLFVYLRLDTNPDAGQDAKVEALEKAGHPVVRIDIPDTLHLGAEFFRWEAAVATAGAVIGINAFNQPNVQESKDFTKAYLAEYAVEGYLPENRLLGCEDGFEAFADDENIKFFKQELGNDNSIESILRAHLDRLGEGDYFAINAYIECCPRLEQKLQKIRDLVLSKFKVATTVGFGPRFLHSTGQLHKGGPNSGVFLQITSEDKQDLAIPGEKYGFAVLKEAQALGDFQALSSRNRRLVRLQLPADVDAALEKIAQMLA